MTRRIGLFFALIMLFAAILPVTAQDQRTLDRIDQAMAHLTSWLERENPITRTTHGWQWQEAIYGDAAFDCGVAGIEYPATPNRAFQVNITVDGTTYDYRVSGDGAILVLCGADGIPLFRSDTPVDQAEEEDAIIPTGDWYAMVYSDGTDLIRLFNADGLQATLKRPEVPNEAVPSEVQLAVSRDGRYLVQNIRLANNNYAISTYDIREGIQRTLAAGAGETASLGVSSAAIFNADSTEVAVSFANLNPENVENPWRVAVIDLETGTVVREINGAGLAPILLSGGSELTNAISGESGVFFPQVAYVDNAGGIHVRMIRWFAGGTPAYPAFMWRPDAGVANISPYSILDADILLTTGAALYAFNDPATPTIAFEGPFTPPNTIARGIPNNTVLQQEILHSSGNFGHRSPVWGADGDLALFRVSNPQVDTQWALADAAGTGLPFTLLPATYVDVIGIPQGFLALTEVGEAGSDVVFHADNIPGPVVFTAPPQNGETSLLWALPAGTTFGVDQISVGDLVSLPADSVYLGGGINTPDDDTAEPVVDGPVLCEGTPPSQVSVGTRAQATAPLNVRTLPGTSAENAIVDVLAEGTAFDIVGGPECIDGFTWWRLELDGAIFAWAAEGDLDDYFLEPLP